MEWVAAIALVLVAFINAAGLIIVAKIGRDMKTLEKNTNSKMTELGVALEAKGLAQGLIEGRAAERSDAAAERK